MNFDTKKTILLVEDKLLIAMAKQKELEKYGYNVIHVNTGEKAVSLSNDNCEIDLILMDIDLGKGIDGTEAAALITKRKDIPIVFLSSHMDPEIVEKTEKITSYGFVVKSSSITVLDASIKMAFKLFSAKKELKQTQQIEKETTENLTSLINNRKESIWSIDSNYNFLSFNNYFKEIYQKVINIELKKGLSSLSAFPEHTGSFKPRYTEALSGKEVVFEHSSTIDNKLYFYEVSLNPIIKNNKVTGIMALSIDITDKKMAEEKIKHQFNDLKKSHRQIKEQSEELRELAIRDELTGLYNRRFFNEQIVLFHTNAQRYNHPLSIVLGDIDFFKKVNDTFSHLIGDKVLVKVSEIIKDGLRNSDIVARFGGEEMIIALPETESEVAFSIIERIRQTLEQYHWSEIAEGLKLTMSFGVCSNYALSSYEKMVAIADKNLYKAKKSGRNKVIANNDDDVSFR